MSSIKLPKLPFGKKTEEEEFSRFSSYAEESYTTYFIGEDAKKVKDLIVPDAAKTSEESYLMIDDKGQQAYYRGFQIVEMPLTAVPGLTFSKLMNYTGIYTTVLIKPLSKAEADKRVRKRINVLLSEITQAKGEVNRTRELEMEYAGAEELAVAIGDGKTTLYDVGFLFLLKRSSVEELNRATTDFVAKAAQRSIVLGATYAAHTEAFMTSFPFNKEAKVHFAKFPVKKRLVIRHMMDDEALTTIYNHTSSEYYHENGFPLGINLSNNAPIAYDFYDKSRISYGMLVLGNTGFGKSLGLKVSLARFVAMGGRVVSIDYDSPGGSVGEYAQVAQRVGGVNYTIGVGEGTHINLFEIAPDSEYDRRLRKERITFALSAKVEDITNILLTLAFANSGDDTASMDPIFFSRAEAIVKECVKALYEKIGVEDGNPDSLYEMSADDFGSGRKKKRLPRMKDFYLELYRHAMYNDDRYKNDVYSLLIDKYASWVKELYFCTACGEEFTREQYDGLRDAKTAQGEEIKAHAHRELDENGKEVTRYYPVKAVKGTSSYFDYETTIKPEDNRAWYNFDISNTPVSIRPALNLVVVNYILENFVKHNSSDPSKAKKLVFLTDEFHMVLKALKKGAVKSYDTLYRTARKHYVAPILASQGFSEFAECGQAILDQAEVYWCYKISPSEREMLKVNGRLTDSQVERILAQGGDSKQKRPGEMCIIDKPTHQATFCRVDYYEEIEKDFAETNLEKMAAYITESEKNG